MSKDSVHYLIMFYRPLGTQSPCDISNGGCSDKCSVTNDSSIQCGCSDTSLVIGNRGRMCIQANHTCQSDEFVCSNGQCLKYVLS